MGPARGLDGDRRAPSLAGSTQPFTRQARFEGSLLASLFVVKAREVRVTGVHDALLSGGTALAFG